MRHHFTSTFTRRLLGTAVAAALALVLLAPVGTVDGTLEARAHMETLAFYFPVVVREQAVLRMHWGTTIIPLRIEAPAPPA